MTSTSFYQRVATGYTATGTPTGLTISVATATGSGLRPARSNLGTRCRHSNVRWAGHPGQHLHP
jgi:hypothetical protein